MTKPYRFDYIQSSATDVISKGTKEKIAALMKELTAIGAKISLQIHDEVSVTCVPGTEDQVRAIYDKYFPQQE